jgi:hypothetical protein
VFWKSIEDIAVIQKHVADQPAANKRPRKIYAQPLQNDTALVPIADADSETGLVLHSAAAYDDYSKYELQVVLADKDEEIASLQAAIYIN